MYTSKLILFVVFVLPTIVSAIEKKEIPEQDIMTRQMKEAYDRLQPIHIYGKVVDQDGVSVGGVEVKIVWYNAGVLIGANNERHEKWVLSDSRGIWEFRVEKPWRAFVADAIKSGFECVEIQDADHNLLDPGLKKEAPVIVRLRKKGETTFLIRREGPRSLRAYSPHSQTNGLDLMEERPDKLRKGSYTDIQLAINWLPNSNRWEVVFSAPNGADGLLVGTNLLYEAPQDGYQKNVAVNGPPWPQYVYLRSRVQPLYTRIDLEYYPWKGSDTNQVLGICYKAWVNPFGERNLEYDQRSLKSRRVERELTQEAKAAIEKGRLYQKPDIEQRIKAMNERLEKEKAEKAQD